MPVAFSIQYRICIEQYYEQAGRYSVHGTQYTVLGTQYSVLSTRCRKRSIA